MFNNKSNRRSDRKVKVISKFNGEIYEKFLFSAPANSANPIHSSHSHVKMYSYNCQILCSNLLFKPQCFSTPDRTSCFMNKSSLIRNKPPSPALKGKEETPIQIEFDYITTTNNKEKKNHTATKPFPGFNHPLSKRTRQRELT
jgi:hypothetical protein